MSPGVSLARDPVLIGGDHAQPLVLRMWGMEANPVAPCAGVPPGLWWQGTTDVGRWRATSCGLRAT